MALVDINWNPSSKDLRIFAALQIVFFAIVAVMALNKGASNTVAVSIVTVSTIAGIVGCVKPSVIRPIYVGWMVAVFPIGWTVSHLILAVIFYLIFTSIGLIMKLVGRNPLARSFDRTVTTYWKPRTTPSDSSRYFRQF